MTTLAMSLDHLHERIDRAECGNCGHTMRLEDVADIEDAQQRLFAGDETPAGECTKCGALAYIVQPAPAKNELAAALAALLEQVYQMRGLFDDEDGAIARAVADAEKALQ